MVSLLTPCSINKSCISSLQYIYCKLDIQSCIIYTMTTKKQLFDFLDSSKEKIETTIDESAIRVCGIKHLRSVIKDSESLGFIFGITSSTADDVISFLLDKSHLRKVKFLTPRVEALYLWRNPNEYEALWELP